MTDEIARRMEQKIEEQKDHIRQLQATLAAREAQLPKEMPDCTIVFKECPLGHGRLTATNWIDRGCVICERNAARQDAARLREALEAALPIAVEWCSPEEAEEVAAIEQAQRALKGA